MLFGWRDGATILGGRAAVRLVFYASTKVGAKNGRFSEASNHHFEERCVTIIRFEPGNGGCFNGQWGCDGLMVCGNELPSSIYTLNAWRNSISILIESDGGFAAKAAEARGFSSRLKDIQYVFFVYIYIYMYVHMLFTDIHIILLAFMFSEVYHDSHLTPKDRIAALSSKRNRAKLRKGRFGEGKKDFCPTGYEPKRTSWISICLEGGKPP